MGLGVWGAQMISSLMCVIWGLSWGIKLWWGGTHHVLFISPSNIPFLCPWAQEQTGFAASLPVTKIKLALEGSRRFAMNRAN